MIRAKLEKDALAAEKMNEELENGNEQIDY